MLNRLITIGPMFLLIISACQPRTNPPDVVQTPHTTPPIQNVTKTALVTTPTLLPSSTSTPSERALVSPQSTENPSQTPILRPTSTTHPTSTQRQPDQSSEAIIIDHTSIELFDQIPEEYLAKARELRMMYADASVGFNISEGLNCLAAPSWAASAPACRNDYIDKEGRWRTFTQADNAAGRVPSRIQFTPDPVKYDRSNWTFEALPGSWTDITRDFVESLAPSYLASADVLSYQFNYFHVSPFSDIVDPEKGFFVDQPGRYDFKELEAFIAKHPDKTFFFWTTSLARNTGTQIATDFNNQMRRYALDNDLILFDVADIESHTDQGIPCYDSRDSIEYCSRRADGTIIKCENEPDDGLEIPAICQDYTTEPDAGHLGSVSSGAIRLAKAYWVLMARIAGWQP